MCIKLLLQVFLPLNERFRFLPLEGSMSRCVYLQISGGVFLFFFPYATQEFWVFIIKCCIILRGLMQDFVRKKQYFISFYIPFINLLHLLMFFLFLFCSPAAPCCFPFRSPCVFSMYFFPPFIYGRLLRGLFLLRRQHFLLASSSRICAALPFSFYPSSNFLS